MDQQLIRKWVDEGLINQDQAERMLADLLEDKRERRSSKFIIVVSTIGAVALGVSAILFIASNWQVLSTAVKMLTLIGATGAAYAAGYWLKYESGELERVGGALMFLGALLFGATVMLTAQIYHINANEHFLVLLWLIGALPLVYATRSVPMAGLAAVLLFTWLWLLVGGFNFARHPLNWLLLFSASALALFGAGGLHYLHPGLESVARTWRIIALKVVMVVLFLLTFTWFSRLDERLFDESMLLRTEIIAAFVLAFGALGLNGLLRREEPDIGLESGAALAVAGLLLVFFLFPSTGNAWVIAFNLLFPALVLLFIYRGYARGDIRVINLGLSWGAAFLLARYFDWFWDLLDRSLFFLIGGVILVGGSIALEKQRRRIKSRFGQ